jgi:carboxymethylenebutenolidase
MISFGKRRDAGTGYLARSERVGPGVLVLHEFFGLTPSFKKACDRLNEAGFTALAPDLYDGVIATSVDEARELAESLDVEAAMLRLGAAAGHLTSNWHPRLGAIGFSLGAGLGLEFASRRDLEALVLYYGAFEPGGDKALPPLLGHFAESDEWEPKDDVARLAVRLEEKGVDLEFHFYEKTGHWFANEDVPGSFDREAAALAWGRTTDFLTYHLA